MGSCRLEKNREMGTTCGALLASLLSANSASCSSAPGPAGFGSRNRTGVRGETHRSKRRGGQEQGRKRRNVKTAMKGA